MKKQILICIDRDGTINYDDKYYLGSQKNWKDLIKFLPRVIEGIKILNKIPNVHIYITTNQSGIATKDFKLLTEKKAHIVTEEIISRLKKKGAKIDGYVVCPHVPESYTKKYPDRKFDKKLVCECACIKPKPGMIITAMQKENLLASETNIYVMGDRMSDVHTAHNVKGFGILIPFKEEGGKEQIKLIKKLNHKETHFSTNFLDAAKFIKKRES